MIAPTNTIHIATVPWDSSYSEVMYFENETARDSYLTSVTSYTDTNCTFIRKEEAVNVAVRYNDVLRSNYVWFYNSDFLGSQGQKFVGCFIDRIEYVSPERTKLYLKEDVWTTWVFLIDEWSDCYVKRQHVAKSDDIIGKYRLVDNDEYVYVIGTSEDFYELNNLCFVLCETYPNTQAQIRILWNEIVGERYLYYEYSSDGFAALVDEVERVTGDATSTQRIIGIMTVPKPFLPGYNNGDLIYQDSLTSEIQDNFIISTEKYTPPSQIGQYTPLNNIMLQYPYMFLNMRSANGSNVKLHYEDLCPPGTDTRMYSFKLLFPVKYGASITSIPAYYKGYDYLTKQSIHGLLPYSVTTAPTSTGTWNENGFDLWWSQNSVLWAGGSTFNALESMQGLVNTARPIKGGGVGVSGSNLASAAISMTQPFLTLLQALNIDDRFSGSINTTALNWAFLNNIFRDEIEIREQDARRIDGVYSRYGYPIEAITTPGVSNRSIFNYIQTQGIHISGNLPDYARKQIAQAFDNGITIWHTTQNFGEYNQSIFSSNN